MTRDPVTVPAEHTLGEFFDDVAWQRRHTTYPVLDEGRFVGLLAFRCVLSIPRDQWDKRSVRSCMIPAEDVPRLRLEEAAIDALVELSETRANRGVVLDDGHVVGILSAADLGRALEAGPRPRSVARSRDHAEASGGGARRRWA